MSRIRLGKRVAYWFAATLLDGMAGLYFSKCIEGAQGLKFSTILA